MAEYIWVLPEVVYALHQRQLAEHGGDSGVRDEGLLESALARPQNLLAYGDPEPDLAALATAYAYGIVKNHAFIDGNKRVAYVTARLFLLLNGFDLAAPPAEKLEMMVKLADSTITEEEYGDWVRLHLVKIR